MNSGTRWSRRFSDLLPVLLTATAIASVAMLVMRELGRAAPTEEPLVSEVRDWQYYATTGTRIGPDSARVVLTLFSDIRCPHCREAWLALASIRHEYEDRIAIVYRHAPIRAFGVDASRAGVCAARQGGLDRLYDRYVAEQANVDIVPQVVLEASMWTTLARTVGLKDVERFTECMEDPELPGELVRDMEAAKRLGVSAVPTLLVNGRRYDGNPPSSLLRTMVNQALADTEREVH